MSHLDSWEDDPAAQDEHLARQAQQNLNLNPQTSTFRPGAASFQPGQPYQSRGASPQYGTYQPQQAYSQYNQIYNQQGGYGQYYAQQYGDYNTMPQQKQWRPQNTAQPPKPAPVAADPPVAAKPSESPDSNTPAAPAPKTKILSIGADVPKPKAPSSTTPAPTPKAAPGPDGGPEAASKVTAAKAIEKTEKKSAGSGKTSPAPSSGRSSPSRAEAKAPIRDADAVSREQAADVDEATLREIYGEKREHVNLIFIGHVDAGKSTLGGSILYATGMVDERTMEKYKKEAKDAGRETWYLSWALDLTSEERSKGKTVEVGRAFFKTSGETSDGPMTRHYTILDAPGHKSFVPNMIGGASQADVGILVISARKGEYETGFERGGQTREHALLARNAGVKKLIVAVNKMDDPTVEWSKTRYEECSTKIGKFLEAMGYKKSDLKFMPLSAQKTIGINSPVPKDLAPWWNGPSLLDYLHNMKMPERKINAPFMMPISAKYKDMGTVIEGRIESGVLKKGSTCILMPNREEVTVTALYGETEEEITTATCGDQIRARLRGVEEEDIMPGFVMCSPKRPVHCVSAFEAKIRILDLKSILTAGFDCVMHVHAAIEEVTFAALLHKLEKETGRRSKKPPAFANKGQTIIARLEVMGGAGSVCVERFEDYNQLGRFTLREQGQTIAIGMITKLITDNAETAT
ncbi:translation termination factor GTPase eRF3 [Ophidiomyces ophidiicola]|nr:translation termination factor GTPase eRF3 [Ophidiomyces ophidiicola]KAI1928216.1 translation termination factor GTPase eRF3 [Ophidiomyces ophidiicola]KAI2033386.1 translation termination factor GTPase eRF3 [Ophidiomyces ophidiicola]KAI2072779.1 translation termination factor GTPase eRF3 [Ophidiomyces ophidiicola]KAI2131394.1 translation termination factor GTPase eRF3 [Ophidiomyces ophidiicola]